MEKRSLLSSRDKETMMVCLVRNEVVFETVREMLTPEHFGEFDQGYALVWGLVIKFYEEQEELPDRALLFAEVESAIEDNPDMLDEQERLDMEAFLDVAFDDEDPRAIGAKATTDKYTKWGIRTAKKFLEERLAAEIQTTVQSKGRIVSNLPEMLEDIRARADAIETLNPYDDDDDCLFPEGWDKQGGIHMTSCGISFLDDFLGGGQAPGEVYVMMGPFGSCKTTMSVMLAVEGAKRAKEMKADKATWDGKHRISFLVSYEARRATELRLRILSYSARIRRSSLEHMGTDGFKTLTTAKTLKPYEKKMFAKQLEEQKKVLGEQGRAKRAQAFLNQHLVVMDMTGYDEKYRGAGSGYVPEISRRISAELRKASRKYGCECVAEVVVIDYVGAMVKRHMATSKKSNDEMRHLFAGAPLQIRNLIADNFNVPVWVMGQLNGDANSKSPGAKMHHTDAAESKSLGENADFAIVIGTMTADNLGTIECTKHRRTGSKQHKVIYVHGDMNKVDDTNGKYVLDPTDRKIKDAKLVHSTAGSASQKEKAKKVVSGTSVEDMEEQDL